MYNVFRKAKDSTKIHRTVIKQMLTMFLTCDNGLISAIFLRNLCVQKTKPVRSLRNLCVTIDQYDYDASVFTPFIGAPITADHLRSCLVFVYRKVCKNSSRFCHVKTVKK